VRPPRPGNNHTIEDRHGQDLQRVRQICLPTESVAITVALRCSHRRGALLRIYPCPRARAWHLTKRPTWTPAVCSASAETPHVGYRTRMAATLAELVTVHESALMSVVASSNDAGYSVPAARAVIDAWCYWGLVYPNGLTITAIDVEALREIATHGWSRWLASRSAHLVSTRASHDL